MPCVVSSEAVAAMHHKGRCTRAERVSAVVSRPRYMSGTNTKASQSEVRLGAKSQRPSRGLPGVATAVMNLYAFFGRLSTAPRKVSLYSIPSLST